MKLGAWLKSLVLERYEAAFRDNEIDEAVLPSLTADDLKDLGVALVGHRRKLLDAIAALRDGTKPPAQEVAQANGDLARDTAERRGVMQIDSAPLRQALAPWRPRVRTQ